MSQHGNGNIVTYEETGGLRGNIDFPLVRRQFLFSKEAMASFLLKVFQRCKCVNFQQSAKTSVLPKWYKERAQVRSGDFMNRFYPLETTYLDDP